MPRYAIKVVPPDWQDTLPLPFHKNIQAYNKIEIGTHVLIYRFEAGIIGDAEIRSPFVLPVAWEAAAKIELPPSLRGADLLLPLEAVYYRGKVVPPETVRQILSDPLFPQLENWRPIDAQTYQQLLRRLL